MSADPIDLNTEDDDATYMRMSVPVRSKTYVDDHGRITLHPRMMRKLGISAGDSVVIHERFGDLYLYLVDD